MTERKHLPGFLVRVAAEQLQKVDKPVDVCRLSRWPRQDQVRVGGAAGHGIAVLPAAVGAVWIESGVKVADIDERRQRRRVLDQWRPTARRHSLPTKYNYQATSVG